MIRTGIRTGSRAALLCAFLGLWSAIPAMACRQALILALDVSLSVDLGEFRLQREGIARALEDEQVAQAMIRAVDRPMEFAVFEWTGEFNQNLLVDWTVIDGRPALARIATQLRETEQTLRSGRTGLGAAMLHAHELLVARRHCARLTLDISGDGRNNNGPQPRAARPVLDAAGITVNALVIEPERASLALSRYFLDHVIAGPEAFVETIYGFDSYAEAIRRKLLRELLPQLSGRAPRPGRQAREIPFAHPPPHEAQGWVPHMRRHAPHLAVAAFGDGQRQPAIGHRFAEAHGRIARPELRRIDHAHLRRARGPILQRDARPQGPERAVRR